MYFSASGVRVQKVAEKFHNHHGGISNSERAESADCESGEAFARYFLPIGLGLCCHNVPIACYRATILRSRNVFIIGNHQRGALRPYFARM
jgi:hypothetical protein